MLELTEISFYFQGISLGIRKLVTEMFSFCIVIEWSKALKTGI